MSKVIKLKFMGEISRHKELLIQLIDRDIKARYRGSKLGIAWIALNPLIMISIYTLIFSQVFNARWGDGAGSTKPIEYGLNLFCGLIVYNLFAECAIKSASIIRGNQNFVKKIVFPLHILGATVTGSALIQGLISSATLIIIEAAYHSSFSWKIILLPLIWLPITLGCLGMSWLIGTIGVFVKDIEQVMATIVNMMLFLSPIFYPTDALPEKLETISNINPLAVAINQTRELIISDNIPSISVYMLSLITSIVWCEFSYSILDKLKSKFAEII